MKVVVLALALAALARAFTCVSPYSELKALCEEVAPKVEALWGKVNATVYLTYGDENLAEGAPGSGKYEIKLKFPDPCTLAHELTHVIEMEKGAYSPKWFAEGLAELSCYLLYPNLYAERGYASWVERGYGDLSPYFFGLTVLYYAYSKGEDVWKLRHLSFKKVAELFAEALQSGRTPFGARPSHPPPSVVELNRGWALGGEPSGSYWKFGKVEVFYGKGSVAYLPALPLLSLFLRRRRRQISSRVRRFG